MTIKRKPRTDSPGNMISKLIKLQPDQNEWLTLEAKRRGIFAAQLVRDLIATEMKRTESAEPDKKTQMP